jgi:hypothetical protein
MLFHHFDDTDCNSIRSKIIENIFMKTFANRCLQGEKNNSPVIHMFFPLWPLIIIEMLKKKIVGNIVQVGKVVI